MENNIVRKVNFDSIRYTDIRTNRDIKVIYADGEMEYAELPNNLMSFSRLDGGPSFITSDGRRYWDSLTIKGDEYPVILNRSPIKGNNRSYTTSKYKVVRTTYKGMS